MYYQTCYFGALLWGCCYTAYVHVYFYTYNIRIVGSKMWPLTTRYLRRTSSLGRSSRGAEGECGCRGDISPQGKASLQSGGDAGGWGT